MLTTLLLYAALASAQAPLVKTQPGSMVRSPSDAVPVLSSHAAEEARVVKSIALRTALRNRGTAGGVSVVGAGASYTTGVWSRDYLHTAEAFPGYFTSTVLRAVVDLFASKIGTNGSYPAFPPEKVVSNGSPQWGSAGSTYPTLDSPSTFALLVALTYNRGDATVYAAEKSHVTAALAALPRQASGGIGESSSVDWGFQDNVLYVTTTTGTSLMASAFAAWAYDEMAGVANTAGDPSFATSLAGGRDTLISAIRTLRRSDGLYNAATSGPNALPHVIGSALVAAKGLCSKSEAKVTGRALADAYLAGTISYRGALRHLVSPNYWDGNTTSLTVDTYQNGGYWHGPWVWWAAQAMWKGGRRTEAQQLLGDAISEVLRQHRIGGVAPYEWIHGTTLGGSTLYAAAGGFLASVADATPATMDVELATTTNFLAGQSVIAASFTADVASTVTVALYSAGRTATAGDSEPPPTTFGAETSLGSVTLANATTGSTGTGGIYPLNISGGYLRPAVASGSATGTMRLTFTPPTPIFVDPASDDFAVDMLATNYTTRGTWAVSTGRLRHTTSVNREVALLKSPVVRDMKVTATMQGAALASRRPALMLRAADPSNGIFVMLAATKLDVYERVANNDTLLCSTGVSAHSDSVDYTVTATVVGSRLTVTDGTVSASCTTAITGTGMGGAQVASSSGTAELQWDNLSVTALQPPPPGMVIEYGGTSGEVAGDRFTGTSNAINLLDSSGATVASGTSAQWIAY